MRAIASLVVVAVLGGCNPRQQVAAGGLAVTVVGLGLTYSGSERDDSSTVNDVGIGMMLVGLVTLFTAAALEETAATEKPREIRAARPRPTPAAAPAARPRDEALRHTEDARAAARAGDCARVTELAAKVGALDPELFADVFMADAPIQACFTAPSAIPPTTTAPTEPAVTAPVDVPGVPVPVPVPAPTPAEPVAP